jgi:hypothetical protein
MADPATTLKAEFGAARLIGDHATMERLGPRLWPEHVEDQPLGDGYSWSDKFRTKVAAKYRADTAKENAAPAFSRAALKARVGELRKAPMLEPAFRRDARLAQLEQAQRQLYEQQPLPGALSL